MVRVSWCARTLKPFEQFYLDVHKTFEGKQQEKDCEEQQKNLRMDNPAVLLHLARQQVSNLKTVLGLTLEEKALGVTAVKSDISIKEPSSQGLKALYTGKQAQIRSSAAVLKASLDSVMQCIHTSRVHRKELESIRRFYTVTCYAKMNTSVQLSLLYDHREALRFDADTGLLQMESETSRDVLQALESQLLSYTRQDVFDLLYHAALKVSGPEVRALQDKIQIQMPDGKPISIALEEGDIVFEGCDSVWANALVQRLVSMTTDGSSEEAVLEHCIDVLYFHRFRDCLHRILDRYCNQRALFTSSYRSLNPAFEHISLHDHQQQPKAFLTLSRRTLTLQPIDASSYSDDAVTLYTLSQLEKHLHQLTQLTQ